MFAPGSIVVPRPCCLQQLAPNAPVRPWAAGAEDYGTWPQVNQICRRPGAIITQTQAIREGLA